MSDPRYVFFGNNWLGVRALRWLSRRGDPPVGLVVHPPAECSYGERLLDAVDLPSDRVFDGSRLGDSAVASAIEALDPDFGLSVLFGYLFDGSFIERFEDGIINLHPAYLPYNRGTYPNVWSIVEGTPAGVSLHYVDEGVDTGELIARRRVPVEPVDTGKTLYHKLEAEGFRLLRAWWSRIREGTVLSRPQPPGGSAHRSDDVEAIDRVDPDETVPAGELIDRIRARTFPPHEGTYLELDGRRVRLRLELDYVDEDAP